MPITEEAAWRYAEGKTPTASSETLVAARDLAKAMIDAGRSTSFILEYVSAYFGDIGREAALAAIEERQTAS
jgi:hypothetical protein